MFSPLLSLFSALSLLSFDDGYKFNRRSGRLRSLVVRKTNLCRREEPEGSRSLERRSLPKGRTRGFEVLGENGGSPSLSGDGGGGE